MKKILFIALIMSMFYACTGGGSTNTATTKTASNVSSNNDEDTSLNLKSIPKLEGPKKRVAIVKFEDKSGNGWYSAGDVGEGMSDMITTEMFKSGNFVLVERESMQNVMAEQKLGQTGLVTAGSAAKIGKLLGANAILIGSVTEFGPKESEISAGGWATSKLTKGVVSNIGLNTQTVRVAVDIRLVDTSTGEILLAETAVAEKKSRNINFSSWSLPSVKMGNSDFDNTLIGKATREAINNVILKVTGTMKDVKWSGYVLKVDGENIIINAGIETGIEKGMQMTVRGPGEEIEDAEGRIFYVPGNDIAEIEITMPMDKISRAKLISGSGIEKDSQIILK